VSIFYRLILTLVVISFLSTGCARVIQPPDPITDTPIPTTSKPIQPALWLVHRVPRLELPKDPKGFSNTFVFVASCEQTSDFALNPLR
jgi:hypothetical protein